MGKVYKLLVRCAPTGKDIDTGIRTSGREALGSAVYQVGIAYCHFCGCSHAYEDSARFEVSGHDLAGSSWRPNL